MRIGVDDETTLGLPVQYLGFQSDLKIQVGGALAAVDVAKFDVSHGGTSTHPGHS